MDTLTHALSGALVGRMLAGRRPAVDARATNVAQVPVWQMVVAGTAAAIFPDLDFVLGWISELTYLRGHRGVTHSLILLPLWGLLIAWLLARFWQRGGRAGVRTYRVFVPDTGAPLAAKSEKASKASCERHHSSCRPSSRAMAWLRPTQ